MKMHKNVHGGTRKNASRKKKELALALCVSLWMAGGSVAGAAGTVTIDTEPVSYDDTGEGYTIDQSYILLNSGYNQLNVTGGTWGAKGVVTGFCAGYTTEAVNPRANPSGYSLSVTGALNLTKPFDFYGAYGEETTDGTTISGNAVNIDHGSITANNDYDINLSGSYIKKDGATTGGSTSDNSVMIDHGTLTAGNIINISGEETLTAMTKVTDGRVKISDSVLSATGSITICGIKNWGEAAAERGSVTISGARGGTNNMPGTRLLANYINIYASEVTDSSYSSAQGSVSLSSDAGFKGNVALYGKSVGGGTGNTLHIGTDGTKDVVWRGYTSTDGAAWTQTNAVNHVKNFDTIALHAVDFTAALPALSITYELAYYSGGTSRPDLSDVTLDLTKLSFVDGDGNPYIPTGGSVTLLKYTPGQYVSPENLTGMKLAYDAATQTTPVALTTTGVEVAKSSGTDTSAGVTLDYTSTHTVALADDLKAVTYSVAGQADKLTFGNVEWKDTGALIDHNTKWAGISFNGAAVDTTKIHFTNIQSLETNKKMTLVSSFGTAAGAITGTTFTVGKGVGEGHAYFESGDIRYVVTKGVTDEKPAAEDNAVDKGGDPVSGKVVGDVTGGVAKNNGVAEQNTKEILPGSEVTGNVTAAVSENGAAEHNEAKVTDAKIGGTVTGAESKGGTVAENQATITGGEVGGVVGANTESGVATGNTAKIENAKVAGNVIGARSQSGAVSNGNKAEITGGSVGGSVYGGKSETGEVNTSQVVISDAKVAGDVFGGFSETGSVDANTVEVSGEISGDVYGGHSVKGTTRNNTITFKGGTVRNLIGGGCETAEGNVVTVTDGEIKDSVYGAKAEKSAVRNTVSLGGGKINQNVYGGYSESGTTTRNNIVTLYGTADVSTASLYGGNQEATGNALIIGRFLENGTESPWTGGDQKVGNIANFETMRFVAAPWNRGKAAITITDGTKSDLSMTTVDASKIYFTGGEAIARNDAMTLLDQSKAGNKATTLNTKSEFLSGSTLQGTGVLSLDDNQNVKYTVENVSAQEQTHNTVMAAEAAMAALSMGNDFIGNATEGLAQAANLGADGVSTFARMGGGVMRQETGSHVDTHTWNAILALGHQNKKERGTTEYGAFFEYGTGNYTTHNDDSQRGDGSARYTGGGLLAKWTANHGFYVEGSFRAGTVHDDAKNVLRDFAGNGYSYDTNANYFGAHLGVGKEIKLTNGNTVDVYGKYFYNRKNGVSFNAGGHYDLDAVTSQILRIGARYTIKRDKWDFYAGAAYEHELDGKTTGTAGGLAIRGADTSGASFRGEIGATMKPGENSPWSLDLNVAGFAGKKQGFSGGVSVAFMF